MKCYFTIDPLMSKKVLIPECYGSLHQEDLSCCTCEDFPTTPSQFERQSYNPVLAAILPQLVQALQG